MPDPMTKLRADIDRYGWHCLHVAPRRGEKGASFTYTIGLAASYDHPEILVFGLPSQTAHGILDECHGLVAAGTRLPIGERVADILGGGYHVLFRPVRTACFPEYLGTAMRYYGDRPFEAVVLFWPDKDDKLPWEGATLSDQSEALGTTG